MKKGPEIDKNGLNEVIHLSKNLLRIFYVITIVSIVAIAVFIGVYTKAFSTLFGLLPVISPLFIGFIIAWLFYPLHRKLLDKKVNKVLSAIIVFAIILIVCFTFIYIFIPVLYKQINDLMGYIPSVLESLTDFVTNFFNNIDIKGIDISSVKDGLLNMVENTIVNLTSSLPNGVLSIVKGFASAIGIIAMSLVVGIYMLIDFDNICDSFYKVLPKKDHDDYINLFKNISLNARRVINGTLLVAFMVFVFDTIGFLIIGLNASVLFGLLCGVTDLIPYIGPYIGGAAAVIVGFTQSPMIGLGVIIVAFAVQCLENYILQPVVMSKAMQLHPVIIIVGLLVFGHFFGIMGMIVATPCMSIIKEVIIFIRRKHIEDK